MKTPLLACLVLFACVTLCAASDTVPYLYQPLAPTAVAPGHGAFTLTVAGTGFDAGAVVRWNGTPLSTTFVSSRQLTATVPAAKVAHATTATITVLNSGKVASNPVYFPVREPGSSSLSLASFDLPTQKDPQAIAATDLNGDGKVDLVTANFLAKTVSVILGNGDGTFHHHVDYPAGSFPMTIATGDFNGDGIVDLAVANWLHSSSGTISILLGSGGGKFSAPTAYTTGPHPFCQTAADLNGDGKLDLVFTSSGANGFSVLMGNGDGTFQPHRDFAAGQALGCLAVGDFNGDGILDVIATNAAAHHSAGLDVYLGNGDGTFQPGYFLSTNSRNPAFIAVGDFDGDGNLDLAIVAVPDVDASGSLDIYLGDGHGSFQVHNAANGVGVCPNSLALGDFNGDGLLDIATNDQCSYAFDVGLGDGSGNFPVVQYSSGSGGGGPIVTGDFNGDGKLDFVLPEGNWGASTVTVLMQQ